MKEELKIFIETKSFLEKITEYSIYFPKRENIFKNGTGLILYIIIKLEQYLIIIPKL